MIDRDRQEILNIAAYLPRMARLQPDAAAILCPDGTDSDGKVRYQQISYAELDRQSSAIARGLGHFGIQRGMRTVLMVKPSLELFTLTFGLFKAGVVPVMVDPGIGLRHLKGCLAQAQPQAFIGIPAAHAARLLLGWGRGTVKASDISGWVDYHWLDQYVVDGLGRVVSWMGAVGRKVQTGRVRQYVVMIIVSTLVLFVLITFFWNFTQAAVH